MSDERYSGGRPHPAGDRGSFDRPRPTGDRGGFERPRFNRPAPPISAQGSPGPMHSVKLREGDRELEVSGSAAFVRQIVDDLPVLLAKLRGETPPRPAAISMPPATVAPEVVPVPLEPQVAANGHAPKKRPSTLESKILAVMRTEKRPLAVAAIRKLLGDDVTAQQVRRTLERSTRVVASQDRPATYRVR